IPVAEQDEASRAAFVSSLRSSLRARGAVAEPVEARLASPPQPVDLPPLPFRRPTSPAVAHRHEPGELTGRRGRSAVLDGLGDDRGADAFGDGLLDDEDPVESLDP